MSETPVYLTKAGLEQFKTELNYLKSVKRQEIVSRVEKARELGDLRENADYQDGKDELGQLDCRVIELTDKIRRAVLVDELRDTEHVSLGCTVTLTSEDRPDKTFVIVGMSEADPIGGRISNESPLGLAVLGKRVGETAELKVPSGIITYTVASIS
jgi:transcription elongation factor GreA